MMQLWRFLQIIAVIWRERLDVHVLNNPLRFRHADPEDRGEAIRRGLEFLGPIFIKLGQALSTRPDLFPADIIKSLSMLQDRVAPFDEAIAKAEIEAALGQPIPELFRYFEDTPLAAASIAQVHAAILHDGSDVVVKVLRPGVEKRVRRDISLMYMLAKIVKLSTEGKRLRPTEIIEEFEKTAVDELDLMREASNCATLRNNFKHSKDVYIPEPHWALSRRNVFVMERIYGTQISDIDGLKAAQVDLPVLARKGVEVFFTQVFAHNFFHADMHPGNVYVDTSTPNDPRYLSIDFGIIGILSLEDRNYLAENLLAFYRRDYYRVAQLHVQSGWVPANTRIEEMAMSISAVAEPIFGRPLKEISFGLVLLRLFEVAKRYDMILQPQLVLLQKTILNVEGLARQLHPDLDLYAVGQPFIETWIKDQRGLPAFKRHLESEAGNWAEIMPALPRLAHQYLASRPSADKAYLQQLQNLEKRLTRPRWAERLALIALGAAAATILLNL